MIVLGYLIDKLEWRSDDLYLGSLTHINYAFAKVGDTSGFVQESFQRAHQIKELKSNFPHLKVCLSIGGLGATYFSETAQTDEGRRQFSSSSIEIMEKYEMDGIDIDWEYPTSGEYGISHSPDDKRNFTLLLQQVRHDLVELTKKTKKPYLLTVAASAISTYIENVELNELNKLLDFMNVMTYDMGGFTEKAGHHTNLYQALDKDFPGGAHYIDEFVAGGMAVNKLVYGIAFYGRGGSNVENVNHGLFSKINGKNSLYYSYDEIAKKMEEGGYTTYYDEVAKAAWIYNDDEFISYDNEQSIIEKMKYVKEKQLLGVMFWQYQADHTNTLLKVINEYKGV